ncbi:MAG TPA: ArsA family ATPase [Anaeromyxobacteraceae bacterium]|nr:ArsA family ATPase [Anaeromyxobacteraceae bacterium]
MSARDARVHVFLGKGGVGKTTCAAATALDFAERGESTLAISTDPTPSLSHIFELEGRQRERPVMPNLSVTELGLEEVRAMWDERFGREVYAVFSAFVDIEYEKFVAFVTSVLPGLNEEFMVDHIRRIALDGRYRHVVWDTAPLGQTLALLGTPALLAEHLRMAPRVYSHLRTSGEHRESVMTVLSRWADLAGACMKFLREEVSFSMVTIAEALAVQQLPGVFAELGKYDLRVDRLIVNDVVKTTDSDFMRKKAEQQAIQLERLRGRYGHAPLIEIPLLPGEVRGVQALRQIAGVLHG